MLDPLSVLSGAFTIYNFILSAVANVQGSKKQLDFLAMSLHRLLTTLDTEFRESRLIASRCVSPLMDLKALLGDVHRFVEAEKDYGFFKLLLHKDSRIWQIEGFHKRIAISTKQISTALNIRDMLVDSQEAQAQDAAILKEQLNTLEKNNANLLRTLEINQNNTLAMMVSLQRQLNKQGGNSPEQRFYTHTLEYLTSRSGKQVKVEDWMISSFEVDYGVEIGAGGFGTVYRGTWNRTEVAVKVLQNGAGISPSLSALRHEIWSTLRHPNILQFLGANTLDDKPFIVMPCMPHNSKEFLRLRPGFDPLYILRDISLGMEYLHSRRICHGDLKAINVLVDNSGKSYLCDFGLSRLKTDVATRTVTRADAPSSLGSRNWMAPELLMGGKCTTGSDVYALSMTLVELYTDEIPFSSFSLISHWDFIDMVVNREQRPRRPECQDGRRMTDTLWDLAEKCWLKDAQTRPTSTEIHDTITRIMTNLPPEPPAEDPKIGKDNRRDSIASLNNFDATAENIRRLGNLQIETMKQRQKELGVSHPETLKSMLDVVSTYSQIGLLDEAVALLAEVIQKQKETLGPSHQDTVGAMYNLASIYQQLGRLEEALTVGSEVADIQRKALGDKDPNTLNALHGLALTYRSMGRFTEAEELLATVIRQRKKV
ncbi:kinase-like domain-containing protein [Mycena leptocephala]|nr:kinase-like domain-containing protein [Mycena leptocephala]